MILIDVIVNIKIMKIINEIKIIIIILINAFDKNYNKHNKKLNSNKISINKYIIILLKEIFLFD